MILPQSTAPPIRCTPPLQSIHWSPRVLLALPLPRCRSRSLAVAVSSHAVVAEAEAGRGLKCQKGGLRRWGDTSVAFSVIGSSLGPRMFEIHPSSELLLLPLPLLLLLPLPLLLILPLLLPFLLLGFDIVAPTLDRQMTVAFACAVRASSSLSRSAATRVHLGMAYFSVGRHTPAQRGVAQRSAACARLHDMCT